MFTANVVELLVTLPVSEFNCWITGVAASRAVANDATLSDLVTGVPPVLAVMTIKSELATTLAAVKAVILGIIYYFLTVS
jgi:hypothetical protein